MDDRHSPVVWKEEVEGRRRRRCTWLLEREEVRRCSCAGGGLLLLLLLATRDEDLLRCARYLGLDVPAWKENRGWRVNSMHLHMFHRWWPSSLKENSSWHQSSAHLQQENGRTCG
jgi:hypothetical protein